jgi:dynein heavy chain
MDIEVPERAQLLFKKVNIYRTQTGNLEIICDMYNEILSILLPVEKPLLQDRVNKMNNTLEPGIVELKWNTQNIDPFINQCMTIVSDVDQLVKKMKNNVKKMESAMKLWQKPLFDRKTRSYLPEDVE